MKKSIMFLSAAVLALSTVFISSCGDDDEGGAKEIPAALIKSITLDEDDGDYVVTWEFTYDGDDRLTLTEVNEDGFEYEITYDYSVAGKLTETEVIEAGVEEYETVFDLDSEGRIIKQYRDDPSEFNTFEYDEDGYLIAYTEVRGANIPFKETATIEDGNITVHTRYGNGTVISRTKVFTYLPASTAKNVSNLPQANLLNSERRTVSGLYGKGSKKLAQYLELNYVGAPEDYVKNSNTYVFDDITNQVVSIQRTGVDVDGNDTGLNELFTYTYYPIEE